MPPLNLKEPEWTIRNGQAVWRLPQGESEIAGEVMVATRNDGQSLVQFTKTPFPLVIARAMPPRWQVEFPSRDKRYSGRGNPPKRLIWLHLARVLAGEPPPPKWAWHSDAKGWQLENPANQESLEGYFDTEK